MNAERTTIDYPCRLQLFRPRYNPDALHAADPTVHLRDEYSAW